ncbi:P-loop containing nucleoside triphosphate hydrolase protein [Polychytrium aggregatum]|uniref:P-loop containing nucleoside triphosphate hydrolase protein n=1 Tax=Polychytrium aggregatum TaxID=110093 RepID=UPI0022FDFC19|nr:P-loop containing nucleoside triphosphate hydrolase protein [Polychytrium aggregatum]KAI9203690.1 P-loop containing nucleoside triphosphate hydrolase protein [Polychytrium aggregatum]
MLPAPEPESTWFENLFFVWMDGPLSRGYKTPLTKNDLFDLLESDKSAEACRVYREQYKHQYKGLNMRLFRMELYPLIIQILLGLAISLLSFTAPLCLYQIMSYIQNPNGRPITVGFFWVFMSLVFGLMSTIVDGQMFNMTNNASYRMRAVLINEIFQKSLRRVSAKGKSKKDEDQSTGKLVSLMSMDTEKLAMASFSGILVTATLIEIVIAVVALFSFLGWSASIGLSIMVVSIPLTSIITTRLNNAYKALMEKADKRNTRTLEALQAIRIIKFFAWEPQFLKRIDEARNAELNNLISYFMTLGLSVMLWSFVPVIVAVVTFLSYTLIAGHDMDATTAFTCLSLFNALKTPADTRLPSQFFQIYVSSDRIEKFLNEPELQKFSDDLPVSHPTGNTEPWTDPVAVEFVDAWFEWHQATAAPDSKSPQLPWHKRLANLFKKQSQQTSETTPLLGSEQPASGADDSSEPKFTLRGLKISFPLGKLSTICGSTGSGKSSIIHALLGEMKSLQGSANLTRLTRSHRSKGGIAFVAQTAWLANATIRDNILFGEPYDQLRYARVIEACALSKDLASFESGDLTEIGEKGINLSGGQKQRVSLARAAYSRAHYILLDDPLSAVDAPTAKHLFDKCITGLLKDRTRILVTHATSLALPATDYLVVINQGQILDHGSVAEVSQNREVETIIAKENLEAVSLQPESDPDAGELDVDLTDEELLSRNYSNGKTPEDAKKLIDAEASRTGAVQGSVYYFYLTAAGGFGVIVAYLGIILVQRSAQVLADYWLKVWADAYNHANELNTMFAVTLSAPLSLSFLNPVSGNDSNTLVDGSSGQSVNVAYYVLMYGLINSCVLFLIITNFAYRSWVGYRAAKKLHDQLITRIMYAPVRWFDVTPLGRITNRLSKDIGTIDQNLANTCAGFFLTTASATTTLIVIGTVTPIFLAVIPFVAYIYYRIAIYYLASSRELKRIHSISRSPIYSTFSECLVGVSTIRAYGHEARFIEDNMIKVDTSNRAHRMLGLSNRWLSTRLSIITSLITFSAGIAIIWSKDLIGVGLAGLSLTWAATIAENLLRIVRIHSQMELNMNSVERVHEYLEIDQEAPAVIETSRPPPGWPAKGHVQLNGVVVRYAPDLDPVLRGVSCEFKGRSKVGVVGRTGAGKSTLTLALFRIMELSGGSIVIDGVDISKIGLRDLRQKLTIIPQDPVLFTGDIRSNLDPFGEHSDDRLWSILERVRFLNTLQAKLDGSSSSDNLPAQTSENQGQTQVQGQNTRAAAEASGFSLDTSVSEGGSNFSQGQRQLLCLARALLKESAITVLDEATASVDNETDAFIQETIRGSEFANSTVVCIAHRLRTIADYDSVLVLSHGEVAEFGTPFELMQREDGVFRKMCQDSGEFEELEKMARARDQAKKAL